MTPFTQYKPWMIERYGDPLFRVPVQLAGSCPHGRCAFCSENGSKAQQTQQQESPIEQIEAAIQFSKRRYKAQKLMLYIQAFSTDLTDPVQQQQIFQCLEKYDFHAISIGTRPDCLPSEALDFLYGLTTLSKVWLNREVWVELGVQTANDQTLKTINRGHDWECSKQAIIALAQRGIHVAPHVILGLPNEVSNDWKRTAEELAELPISGIKIHNLHIMEGTEFAKTMPPTMNHWEYAEALMDFLRRIPAGIPVMRVSTDTPDDQLIAPHWHLEKGQFLDYVIQQMEMREISQGDLRNDEIREEWNNEKPNIPTFQNSNIPVITADGSVTFFSPQWKEHYHTKAGARLEAEKKFVEPSGLATKLHSTTGREADAKRRQRNEVERQTSNIKLLDVCFGLGNNSLAALCAHRADKSVCSTCEADTPVCHSHKLDITALEMDKRVVRAAAESFQTLETDPVDWNQTLENLLSGPVDFPNLGKIDLQFGDARWLIQNIEDNAFDIVFHDPFSSQHCPELWTVEFFQQLCRVLKPDGVLLTYSSSQPVRGAMREAGFHIAETHPGHQMGNGTIASPSPLAPTFPTIGIYDAKGVKLDERRSIPYRDEFLCATSKAILRQRQEAVERF